MLLRADEQLIQRDTELPGLEVLLDSERLGELLQQQIPDHPIDSLHPVYLRYKPGMNCLAAYRLTLDGVEIAMHAKAFRSTEQSKLKKPKQKEVLNSTLGLGVFVFPDPAVVVSLFPNDSKLKSLVKLDSHQQRRVAFEKMFKTHPELWNCEIQKLRYKPERRFVAGLISDGVPCAVLRCYVEADFHNSRAKAKVFRSCGNVQFPRKIAHSKENFWIAYEWMNGSSVDLERSPLDAFRQAGIALAEMHRMQRHNVRHLPRELMIHQMIAQIDDLISLYPDMERFLRNTIGNLAIELAKEPFDSGPIHGDFNATQILLTNNGVGILDLDEIVYGDTGTDVGNFVANLEKEVLIKTISAERSIQIVESLLEGYRSKRTTLQRPGLYAAIGLFRMMAEPFRYRNPDWQEQGKLIFHRLQTILSELISDRARFISHTLIKPEQPSDVPVVDPFSLTVDPLMPFVAEALSPLEMQFQFGKHLPFSKVLPLSIRVTRYKPGRRCLLEYEVIADQKRMTLIGKVRAKGFDRNAFRVLQALHQGSFGNESSDSISVPPPVGMLPDHHMYLQVKVDGISATEMFRKGLPHKAAARVAEAIHKLHCADVPTERRHTVDDELRILHDRLAIVSRQLPQTAERIRQFLNNCKKISADLSDEPACGIHRDFYPDQVIFSNDRLFLLDFDSYCIGHPALDAGNFLAHMTEYGLRKYSSADAWHGYKEAFRLRFLELAGAHLRKNVEIYELLSLARHIYLSTQFTDRSSLTEHLLELCEERISGLRLNLERSCQ